MTAPVRACTVSFLNARPLYAPLLEHPPVDASGQPLFEIERALPSVCADRLASGRCDLALVPVAAYAEHPEWEVVPGIAIAARGPVDTVLVVADVPLDQVEHVWLDAASRSSALLLKTLLAERGLEPTFATAPHDEVIARAGGRAAGLVIGDAAFGLRERFAHVTDLSSEWFAQTGLPMVFAFWAARPGVLSDAHVRALKHARDKGLQFAERHAQAYRDELVAAGQPAAETHVYANYLRRRIRYGFDNYERAGLVEFLTRAQTAGLLGTPSQGDGGHDPLHVQFVDRDYAPALAARRPAAAMDVDALLERAASGGRLDFAEGMFLYEHADVVALGAAADRRRQALHPDGIVTYIIDRNVNYSNVCTARCKFCNFYTPPGGRNGYVLSKDELAQKFRETEALGGVQILLQGGLNPELGLAYYEDLFRWTKRNFTLKLHALSPTEIIHIAHLEDLSIREVLERLRAAGMDSLPGGGAELLHDEIRNRISPFKNTTDEWIEVMRVAHAIGMKSTCTMVFGFQETAEHILVHLDRLRQVQDEALARGTPEAPPPGRFTAFIVWPFQADGTRLKLRDDTSPWRYLRLQALARLYLDNIPNIQVSWPTLGPDIGEVALRFGANDFGSVMIEENVVSQAGAHFMLTAEQIEHHIRQAGFTPSRRNMQYERLSTRRTAPTSSPRTEAPHVPS